MVKAASKTKMSDSPGRHIFLSSTGVDINSKCLLICSKRFG